MICALMIGRASSVGFSSVRVSLVGLPGCSAAKLEWHWATENNLADMPA